MSLLVTSPRQSHDADELHLAEAGDDGRGPWAGERRLDLRPDALVNEHRRSAALPRGHHSEASGQGGDWAGCSVGGRGQIWPPVS